MTQTKTGYKLIRSTDDEGVAYLKLPQHPGCISGIVDKTVELRDLVPWYSGPDVNFDFNKNGVLIGIELIDE